MTQPLPSVKEEMQPSRQNLREILIQRRKDAPLALRQEWDRQICQQLRQLPQIMDAAIIGVYSPIRCEPNLRDFYQDLQASGKRLALPVVLAKDSALAFFEWAPGDVMEKDAFGVLIPARREREVQASTLLIPCVGYNAARYRLGYGGGFYDRTLAKLPHAHSIGVAYRLAQCEFAAANFDLPMSQLITELSN